MSATTYETARNNLQGPAWGPWSVDRQKQLIDAHEEGLTFKAIAARLGQGATRNACIAKAHRLHLPQREMNPPRPRRVPRRPVVRATVPTAARDALPPRPSRVTDPVSIAALALPGLVVGRISDLSANQCRWPVGHPDHDDFALCGRLKAVGGPYCAAHTHAAIDHVATARARRSPPEKLARLAGPVRHWSAST